jgi:hypothetical protein
MTTSKQPVRVFVSDEHPLLLDTFERCASESGFEVVGTSLSLGVENVAARIDASAPDVVIIGRRTLDPSWMADLGARLGSSQTTRMLLLCGTCPVGFDEGIRNLLHRWSAGLALLPIHAIATAEDFAAVVRQVYDGRIVMDTGGGGGDAARQREI